MKKLLLFLLVLLGGESLMAQSGLPMIAGARGAAMGQASVGFQDVHSIFSNQAGLAHLRQTAFTAIGESRFAGFGIRSVGAAAAIPVSAGTFGLALQYFGIEEYNEQKVGIAYARKLFDQLSIGVQFDYLHLRIQDFGVKDLVTFEAGIQSQLSPQLTLGVSVYSPVQIAVFEDENLPTILKFGGLYRISKKLRLAAEVEKDIDFPASLHLGIEYDIIDALALRIGTQTQPNELSFGVGYQVQEQLQIDIAASYHQFLGFSPSFSAVYLWKKK